MGNRELLKKLKEEIEANPAIVPEILEVVQEGMAAWKRSVERSLASNAWWGISAALDMPTRPADWDTRRHGDTARLVRVGWNLHKRTPGCPQEKRLDEFVRKVDEEDPEGSSEHYAVIVQKRKR